MNDYAKGSVVLYTLMILSVVVILTQQLIRGVFVGSNFVATMIDRERAELLALGGVSIAMAQLTFDEEAQKAKVDKKEGGVASKDKPKGDPLKKHLSSLLPSINRWRDFVLTEKVDGFDGRVRVCVTCESGKININNIFDFKKMEFKKPYDSLLKGLEIRGKIPAGEMLARLTDFFKKRKRKLDDISELLEIPGFRALDVFYRPPQKAGKGKKSEANTELALQDIFTTWTSGDKIEFLLLSDALCAIFGVRRPCADDAEVRKGRFKQFFEKFNKQMIQDMDSHWSSFEYLYDQKPKALADYKGIFTKVFEPKVFSVLSCGKVGAVELYVLAIIQETEQHDESDKQKNQQHPMQKNAKAKKPRKFFKILRTYWL